jgi:putative endonuclease
MKWLDQLIRVVSARILRGRPVRETPEHLATGRWGEEIAMRALRAKGYRVVGRRIAVGRDELDIVMRDGDTLVFVEVKTRADGAFGRPSEAITPAKRRRLSRAAVRYLMKRREKPEFIRFDVVEVIGRRDGPAPLVEHIQNAFPMEKRYRLPW